MIVRASMIAHRCLRRARVACFGTLIGVETDRRVAALTFDDGPDPEFTPPLLDLLARFGALGTFFVIGTRAVERPELLDRIVAEGHTIGNHSWDHPRFPTLSGRERRAQVKACSRAIGDRGAPLFRPPYGMQTLASQVSLAGFGLQHVAWNLAVDDWTVHDAEWTADRLSSGIRPGSIVLLHDALWKPDHPEAADRRPMLEALEMVLKEVDFSFVTVPQLLCMGRPILKDWAWVGDAASAKPPGAL